MEENPFKENPPKIIIFNPLTAKCEHIFVSLGNVPAKVAAGVNAGNKAIMRDFYGPKWAKKLASGVNIETYLDTVQESYETVYEHPSEHLTGGYSAGGYSAGGYSTGETLPVECTCIGECECGMIVPVTGGAPRVDPHTSENISLEELDGLLKTTVDDMSFTIQTDNVAMLKRRIKNIKAQSYQHMALGVTYDTSIQIFPEDNLMEVREKIFLMTGIPVYRQHVFWLAADGIHTTYSITTELGVYPVDIRLIASHGNIHGIPVDKELYALAGSIKIDAADIFTLVSEVAAAEPTLFVVDLALFTSPIITQLHEAIRDTYTINMIYYGFVIKYFPMLSLESLNDIIYDETELQSKYPLMAKSRTALNYIYRAERELICRRYERKREVSTMVAITHMTLQVGNPRCVISVRNLFDRLRTSICVPEIHAYIEHGGKRYLLRKRHMRCGDITFPTSAQYKIGLIAAISLKNIKYEDESPRYMFLNIHPNGRYFVKTFWNEEDEVDFVKNIRLVKKYTDDILRSINTLSRTVFIVGDELQLVTAQNVVYTGMNICIFWKRVMLEHTFKVLKTLWEPYMRGGLTATRNVQQFDKYEFLWHKGIHHYDKSLIERIVVASGSAINLSNMYSYMHVNIIRQKWDQHYQGRIVRMSHRTTDVRFEILDVHEDEFKIFQHYINGFIADAINDKRIKASAGARVYSDDMKKLRKLREEDPELYNLKKYGSERVYSILCQNARQPFIYTLDEIKSMGSSRVDKLTKYWNFTLNKPAFYTCPNPDYPHLSFITGMHPKGYCLPCCNKKLDARQGTKSNVVDVCLRDHKYIDADSRASRHVMTYGKIIDPDRIGKLPPMLSELIFSFASAVQSVHNGYYLYGVQQNTQLTNVGAVFAIAHALGYSIGQFILDIGARLKARPELIHTLLNGTLLEYITSMDELLAMLRTIYIDVGLFDNSRKLFTRHNELVIELCSELYGIHVVTFIDETTKTPLKVGSAETSIDVPVHMFCGDAATDAIVSGDPFKLIILMKIQNLCYPIYHMNLDTFTPEIRQYDHEHPFGKLIQRMIMEEPRHERRLPILSDIMAMIAGTKYSLVAKFINNSNKCYGVILTDSAEQFYLPVDYSFHTFDDTPISYNPADIIAGDNSLAGLFEFIGEFNQWSQSREILPYTAMRIYATGNTENKYSADNKSIHSYFAVEFDGPLLAYITPTQELPLDSLEVKIVNHNYIEVDTVIMNHEPPIEDPRAKGLNRALYNTYAYQLLLVEFINYLENERNWKIRDRLNNLFSKSNIRTDISQIQKILREILADWPADFKLISEQLVQFLNSNSSREKILETLSRGVYDFDKLTIAKIARDPAGTIRDVINAITVRGDINTTGEFPNIYVSCAPSTGRAATRIVQGVDDASDESSSDLIYCRDKKLILNDPEDYISLLAADFTNPLKLKYILNSLFADSSADFFKFARYSMEIINIYRM